MDPALGRNTRLTNQHNNNNHYHKEQQKATNKQQQTKTKKQPITNKQQQQPTTTTTTRRRRRRRRRRSSSGSSGSGRRRRREKHKQIGRAGFHGGTQLLEWRTLARLIRLATGQRQCRQYPEFGCSRRKEPTQADEGVDPMFLFLYRVVVFLSIEREEMVQSFNQSTMGWRLRRWE